MRGPHDVGGLDAGLIDTAPHDLAFWEKQIDGVRAVIGAKGIVTSHENRRTIEQLGHDVTSASAITSAGPPRCSAR